MIGLLACQIAWYASLPQLAHNLVATLPLTLTVILALLMIAAMVVPGRAWSTAVMAALVARYVVIYLL